MPKAIKIIDDKEEERQSRALSAIIESARQTEPEAFVSPMALRAKAKSVREIRSDFSRLIGERIRTRRIELGWRQERLGAEFGVGRDSISRYETGQTEINVSDLPHFAKVLKVPISFFFGSTAVSLLMKKEGVAFDQAALGETPASIAGDGPAPVLDEGKLLREAQLLRHFTMLRPEFQEAVILHARALGRLGESPGDPETEPKS